MFDPERAAATPPAPRLTRRASSNILTLLQGTNLRSAGRVHGDGGGEFVFSVRHRPHDDAPDQDACDILTDEDYEARVYQVESFDLDDQEGALLAFIQRVEAKMGEPVIEVHIGPRSGTARSPSNSSHGPCSTADGPIRKERFRRSGEPTTSGSAQPRNRHTTRGRSGSGRAPGRAGPSRPVA